MSVYICEHDVAAEKCRHCRGKPMPPTPAQVHAMCAYLRTSEDKSCGMCPARESTPYGDGEPGCYGIAEETLSKAREILEGR